MDILNNETLDDPLLPDETVDFSGGVYSSARRNQLAPNMVARAINCVIEKNGQLVTRWGAHKIGDDAASANAVLGLAYLDTPSAELLARVIQAGAARKLQTHDGTSGAVWLDATLPGGWTIADALMEIVPVLDKLYLFNGVDESRSFDGTAFAALGTTGSDAPAGSIALWFQYRMFVAGVTAKPDTVFFCDLLDPGPGKWNHVAKSFRVGDGSGDAITALSPWVRTYLAVLKRSSLWIANVDPTISLGGQVPIDQVHDRIGCLARRTVRKVGNDLFFLSDDGVRSLQQSIADGSVQTVTAPLSEPIKDLFARMNKEAAHTACAETFNGRYLIAIPIDSATQPNAVASYNSTLRVWEGYWTGLTPTGFVRSFFGGLQRLNWGQSDGRVLQWRHWVQPQNETGSDFEDAGAPIATTQTLRSHNFQAPKNDKKGLVLELEFDESQASEVTVTAYRDEASTGEEVGSVTSGLGGGITFPLTFPLTFPPQGIKRVTLPLDDLNPFRELALELHAAGGKLALRAARMSGFLETMRLS